MPFIILKKLIIFLNLLKPGTNLSNSEFFLTIMYNFKRFCYLTLRSNIKDNDFYTQTLKIMVFKDSTYHNVCKLTVARMCQAKKYIYLYLKT